MCIVNIYNYVGQTPQDLAAMREAQNNYQKICRESSSNSENRYIHFWYLKKKKKKTC